MTEDVLCAEHNVWHGPPCQRCARSTHDGVVVISNLTTFWNTGIGGVRNPTLCRDCIEDIRVFANTPVVR
jgi:hypothetical protein